MTNAQVLECFMGDYFIVRVSGELKLSPGDWLEIRHDEPPEQPLFAAEDLLAEFYPLAHAALPRPTLRWSARWEREVTINTSPRLPLLRCDDCIERR